jgi:hypothetical protein
MRTWPATKMCLKMESLQATARVLLILLTGLVWSSISSSASALDVADYKWGFNGKVAPHRFNVLSALLNNPTPQPFDGDVVLRKTLGGAGQVDATILEHVTLAPNSSKWVQFYPYITSDGGYSSENWAISWRGGSYPLPVPRIAKYQRVVLDDPNGVSAKGGAVKFHLPDNLFPPFVTATDALQLVVLDHVPRWEETRRQSFLDWLYLGGTVVLLQEPSGKFPDFTGPLSVLKTPLDDQMYGAGRVLRVPLTRPQFGEEEFRQICAGLPKNFQAPNGEKSDDIIDKVDETQQFQPNQNYGYAEGTDPFKSNSFLSQLKQMTKPNHNWVLLHLMFWVYIALVFPGCYLLGKKWSDFRVVYAGLLGTVALFSLLFSYVGQRGYGEATAIHTVAIAKPLPDGQMDVSSWSNIFVTGGAEYEIRHNAFGSLYSTCNEHEQVKGIINNGAEAVFKVDIPPFSNRELAARAKIPFDGPKITMTELKVQDSKLTELELEISGLKRADVEKQYALIGNTFYMLVWRDDKLVLANETGNVQGMLQVQQKHQQYPYGMRYPYGYEAQTPPAERYAQMFDLLLSRSLSVSRDKEAEQLRVPPNTIRVFLYCKMPGEFAVQNKRLGNQEGRVLYAINLSVYDFKKSQP